MSINAKLARVTLGVTFLLPVVASDLAVAQNFPNRNLRLIIPFTPGGVTDILGRLAAQKIR